MDNLSKSKPIPQKRTLFAITWPLFIEVFLQTMMRFTDVFMLSFVSDQAVAAIGVVNQIMILTFVLFNFTAMGSGVVVAQFVGAEKPKDVSLTIANAIVINLLFGMLISLIIVLFREQFLLLFNLSPQLLEYADIYMIIVGGTLFTQAMVLTISSALQAKGFTKEVMLVVLGMNACNILGNYLLIFGVFGFPQLGVTGVAIATALSRTLAMIVLFALLIRRLEIKIQWEDLRNLKGKYVKKIMNIGVPAAGEHLSYNTSQLMITGFISLLGATALATRVYTLNLMALMTIFSMAMAKGMQIYIGQLVGAGRHEEAYHQMYRGLKFALSIALAAGVVLAISGEYLLQIFTNQDDIITVGVTLLFIGIIMEPGKTLNLVIISALRAAGDAKFPVIIGIISMWGLSVPLAYFLGVHLGHGLIGIWLAMVFDEWFRGILMFLRWRSRKWENKGFLEEAKPAT